MQIEICQGPKLSQYYGSNYGIVFAIAVFLLFVLYSLDNDFWHSSIFD